MADINTIYGGDFIKATAQGRLNFCDAPSAIVTFAKVVKLHEFEDGKKQIVIGFLETDQELGLNATNATAMAAICGTTDYDKWKGGPKVELFATPEARSKTGWAVRIRPGPTAAFTPSSEPPMGDLAKAKLFDVLATQKLGLGDLQTHLRGRGCNAAIVNGDPSAWPKSWMTMAKAWIDNPNIDTITPDDIPF